MRTKKEGIVVALFTVFFLSSIAFAVDCPLPDTGQTKCYNNSSEITCPPVETAISDSIAFLRSPKPGAFTAQHFSTP